MLIKKNINILIHIFIWATYFALPLFFLPKPSEFLQSSDQIYLTSFTASPATAISDLRKKGSLGLHTNPSSGIVRFAIIEEMSGTNLEVLNLSGQVVYQGKIISGDAKLDLSHLNKRLYFVRIGDKKQRLIIH